MKVTRREFIKSQAAVAAATAGVTLPLSTTAIAKDMQDNAGKPADQLTSRVGMFGSGQWAVWDGYAASKFMKAGLRSNNLDPNARH